MAVQRQTVDLSAYQDLVVIYLGMRVRRPRGMLRLLGLGQFLRDSGGSGVRHETYLMGGGMEAVYEFEVKDMPVTVAVDARGESVHESGPAEWRGKIKGIPVKTAVQ